MGTQTAQSQSATLQHTRRQRGMTDKQTDKQTDFPRHYSKMLQIKYVY